MTQRRILYGLIALTGLLIGGYAFEGVLRQFGRDAARQFFETLRPDVDVELKGIRFSETAGGHRKYLLEAESATYSARGVSLVHKIRLSFYDESGRETMQLSARQGDLAEENRKVTIRGDVTLRGSNGLLLETDHVTYDKTSGQIVTDAVVRLETPQGHLQGRGMIVYPQQERFILLHDIQAQFGSLPPARKNGAI